MCDLTHCDPDHSPHGAQGSWAAGSAQPPLRAQHVALGPKGSNAGCGDGMGPRAGFDSEELKNHNSLSLFLASGFWMSLPTPRRCDKEWV